MVLYEMCVIQFLHGINLQKNTYNCIGMGIIIEVRLIIIHNDTIQVMIVSAMDSIEGKVYMYTKLTFN